jgi:hypothetical protein
MVRASAPTYEAETTVSGGTISGNNETGRISIDRAPMINVTSEITIANMGRLIKKLDMLTQLIFCICRGSAVGRACILGRPENLDAAAD